MLAKEKLELERLRAEILQLKADAVAPAGNVKFSEGTKGPSAPKTRPPSNRRSSAVLGKAGAGLTLADGFGT